MEDKIPEFKGTQPAAGTHNRCKACGQKFSLKQRILVTNHAIMRCKQCNTQYKVQMQMNTAWVGAIGGGSGGACIIFGYLIGDKYFMQPALGLVMGVLLAALITYLIYRYTWKKVTLQQI